MTAEQPCGRSHARRRAWPAPPSQRLQANRRSSQAQDMGKGQVTMNLKNYAREGIQWDLKNHECELQVKWLCPGLGEILPRRPDALATCAGRGALWLAPCDAALHADGEARREKGLGPRVVPTRRLH